MIKARPHRAASCGEPCGVNDCTEFYAELCRGASECCFDFRGVEFLKQTEAIANSFESRFVFRSEMLRCALRIVLKIISEVESAISRQLVERVDFSFASLQRGADVVLWIIIQLHTAQLQGHDC